MSSIPFLTEVHLLLLLKIKGEKTNPNSGIFSSYHVDTETYCFVMLKHSVITSVIACYFYNNLPVLPLKKKISSLMQHIYQSPKFFKK